MIGLTKSNPVASRQLIISEIEKNNPFLTDSIQSLDYARYIKESRDSWHEGFGLISQRIGRMRDNKTLPKIGAYIFKDAKEFRGNTVLCAEYYGKGYEEYFELSQEIIDLYEEEQWEILFEEKGFTSFNKEPQQFPLLSVYRQLQEKLSTVIGKECSLSTNNKALLEESAWYAAYFLTGKYPLNTFPDPIPVIEIGNCFDKNSQWKHSVSRHELLSIVPRNLSV